MSQKVSAALAVLLLLGAVPAALAADEQPSASPAITVQATLDPNATQSIKAPLVGLSLSFPASWRVSLPEGTRVSEITTAEGEPIMATTAILANGSGGQWCDVDAYLSMVAPLEQHAYAYAAYLQKVFSSIPMVVTKTELPSGPAFRIEIFDDQTGRLRSLYLFDGLPAEDGSFDRFLLTCTTPAGADALGQAIAESAVLFEPAMVEAPSVPPPADE
jgi:hypothetical protein